MACVEETVLKQVEAERNRLTGVRGVLGFFLVGFVVGSAAYVLYGLLLLATGIWLYAACGVLFLILAGYGFYASSLLIHKRSSAPWHAGRVLILGSLLSVFMVAVNWAVRDRLDLSPLTGGVGTLMWLAYLSWSRRVAYTYGGPAKAQ
jgi:glucose dehydrogenase